MKQICVVLFLLWYSISFAQTEIWSTLNNGLNNNGRVELLWNGNLYVGGEFTQADGNTANYIAKWDGSSWVTLGQGFNGRVQCLAVYNNQLFAGGYFSMADGHTCRHIARWTGAVWDTVGWGVSGYGVYALAEYNGELYATGQFARAGYVTTLGVAKWSGNTWSVVGDWTGLHSSQYAYGWTMLVCDSKLYIGGYFDSICNTAAMRVGCWDGASWAGVGAGFFGPVYCLAEYQNHLYAGGSFVLTGDYHGAMHLAMWNDSSWVGFGVGTNYSIYTMQSYGNNLYLGGYFTVAGQDSTNHIAIFDGNQFHGFALGLDSSVYSLVVDEGILYATGAFTHAGTLWTNHIAKWSDPGVGISEFRPIAISIFPNPTNGLIHVTIPNDNRGCVLEIYNAIGICSRRVELEGEETVIDLTGEASGMYFYHLLSNGNVIAFGKLIKE